LWQLAADARATTFGASPTFVQMMRKAGIVPRERFDLSALRTVLLTGSPVTPESTAWFYESVKDDLWVTLALGGTELCAGARRRLAASAGVCGRDSDACCSAWTFMLGTRTAKRSWARWESWS
jgi:acyl-coenzyme A synthetase/AMP-(fatty) acid ligase